MNELGYDCLKKILYRLKDSISSTQEFDKHISSENFNLNDMTVLLISLFLNTGYIFKEKLNKIDWKITPDEFESLVILNGDIMNSFKIEDSGNITYSPDILKILNNFLQIIRNGAAHNRLKKDKDFNELIIQFDNNSLTLGYNNIYWLLYKLIEYIIDNYFTNIETYEITNIDYNMSYLEIKNNYLKEYNNTKIYPLIENTFKEIENLKYEDLVAEIYDNYDNGLISEIELNRLLSEKGQINPADNWILKFKVEYRINKLFETLPNKTTLNNFEKKYQEYNAIFNEIYRIYMNEEHSLDNTMIIEEYLEEINNDFDILNEKLWNIKSENYSQDKMYLLVLLTIIFGFGDWNKVDIESIDFSDLKINKELTISKQNTYNKKIIDNYKKYEYYNKKLLKVKNNNKIPDDSKKIIVDSIMENINGIIENIYDIKQNNDSYNSNSNIQRHLRNSFCHGYYTIQNNDIIIEDYNSDDIKTFEGTININKLLTNILNNDTLDKLYNNKNINNKIRR